MNEQAFYRHMHFLSLLVNELKSPYPDGMPNYDELNIDTSYHNDWEIYENDKLNYLAQMEFWKDYICLFHQQNNDTEIVKIHDDYIKLIKKLLPNE